MARPTRAMLPSREYRENRCAHCGVDLTGKSWVPVPVCTAGPDPRRQSMKKAKKGWRDSSLTRMVCQTCAPLFNPDGVLKGVSEAVAEAFDPPIPMLGETVLKEKVK